MIYEFWNILRVCLFYFYLFTLYFVYTGNHMALKKKAQGLNSYYFKSFQQSIFTYCQFLSLVGVLIFCLFICFGWLIFLVLKTF